MSMFRKASLALLFSMLAACAGPQWVKAGATAEQDFNRDVAQCKYEAALGTASYSGGPTARTTGGAIGQGIGEGIDLGLRQRNLIILCLQARGYSQRQASPGL